MVSRKLSSCLLVPAFPRAIFCSSNPKSLSNAAWIDGVRGLAALIVTIDHLFWGRIDTLFQGYGAAPSSENHSLFQLPVIRILWAGPAMVPLFFVVSGYCISLSSIRPRDSRTLPHRTTAPDTLLQTLSSALFRRALRLFLPVLFVSILSQLLYMANLYTWPWLEDTANLPAPGLTAAPLAHVSYLFSYLLALLDSVITGFNCPFGSTCVRGLNTQLWTLPRELRGSVLVYVALLALAEVRRTPRVCVLGVLAGLLWASGWWDPAAFVAGLVIAEVELQRAHYAAAAHGKWRSIGLTALWLAGLYLLCTPQDTETERFSPFYAFLAPLTPQRWLDTGGLDRARGCWHSLGGFFLVTSLSASAPSSLLRRPFETNFAQYFGRVSFMLYLVHQLMIRVLLLPVRGVVLRMMGGGEERFMVAVYCAGAVVLVVAFWVAEILVELVDKPSAAVAKRLLERWAEVRVMFS